MAPVPNVSSFAVILTLASCAVGANGLLSAPAKASGDSHAAGFMHSMDFKHRLRVCNAYPNPEALEVYRGHTERLTDDGPMPYKTCRDFVAPLKVGDKLGFKVGDANAGTFSVSDLPMNDAILLLIIHRHDKVSTAVSFESHIFANLLNSQIAVIDTYRGSEKGYARILDSDAVQGKGSPTRSEELRYDSVVAVNPGAYEITLADENGVTKLQSELVALNRESYVVLRVGVEAESGTEYPQELLVYPHSDIRRLLGGAQSRTAPFGLLVTLAALWWASAATPML